jgi:hypothetical protein
MLPVTLFISSPFLWTFGGCQNNASSSYIIQVYADDDDGKVSVHGLLGQKEIGRH